MQLMDRLGRLFRRSSQTNMVEFPPVAPDAPFYVVGDIHGRMDLLERLMPQLRSEWPVVFVGDYVDRGEQSDAVLSCLWGLSKDSDREVICLKGNHEDMMLKFLENPEKNAARWLRYGGLQTLAAYGVRNVSEAMRDGDEAVVAHELSTAMGWELVDWLSRRPVMHRSGNVAVTHAGADPSIGIEDQRAETLMWGHRDFVSVPRTDAVWVAHGHTIVDGPRAGQGVISVDTGAYATGRLTAAAVLPGDVEFLSES